MNRYLSILLVFVGAVMIARFDTHDGRCERAFLGQGLTMPTCPSGAIRQTARLDVRNVRRGAEATARLAVSANYTVADADAVQTIDVPSPAKLTLTLLDASKQATPIPVTKWARGTATFKIPEVADGDYTLRATFATRIGPGELDVKLPLFTPARVHVITDRPLYEPGNTVRFRAVVLRARDLAPLDGRPGRWIVKDPNGEVLLEEAAPATDWGVVAGTFPIDQLGQTGNWTVAWASADAIDEVGFKVEPFKLPRFRVEASTERPFYRAGDRPTIKGAVIYSSGAPVAGAQVDITWRFDGEWPPPLAWEESLLPKHAVTTAAGRFELALPEIPADLQGKVSMTANLSAVDPAGDRVASSAVVLLSEDGIQASAVTELGDGLVDGFNNRIYVRVTTPDGQVVRNSKVNLKRAWQPNDPGIDADLDEDGVASLQVDPGAPVNIVIPARPYRPIKKPPLVTRDEPNELIADEGASLADQVEMDRWLAPLGACAKWVGATATDGAGDEDDESGGNDARIGMRVAASGTIVTVGAGPSPLGQCVAGIVRGRRLPAGSERLYTVSFSFEDPELSKLTAEVVSALEIPDGLEEGVANLAKSTRDCLPQIEGELPRALTWQVRGGSKEATLGTWIAVPGGGPAGAAIGCVQQRFGTRVRLSEAATHDALGLIKFAVEPPETVRQARPQATTMLGYELTVTAAGLDGKPSTKLRVSPGEVPPLRLRVTPILAAAGGQITAELIRGPEFAGSLPKKLVLRHLKGKLEAELDADRRAQFTLEAGTEGWCEITGGGQRALVYVRPQTDLVVSIEAAQPRYKPGDQAELRVQTRIGGKGGQAAVGLFGVDESLGQLVTLAQPDAMGRLQPKVETGAPAFGLLDGQALTLGRIRGANAAAATVLRVTSIPSAPELDAVINATASSRFDPVEELTDNFYTVLAELHTQARRWEAAAPAGTKMRPAAMAELWNQALAACKQRGEKIGDAYGRPLRLALLPDDLLALTDPRAVIVVGTRLPEDVENWPAWVRRVKP